MCGLLISLAALDVEHGALGHVGIGSGGVRAQWLQLTSLVAPWHVGSSQNRDRTHVSCTGRRIPISVPPGKLQEHCFRIVNLQFDFNCA